MLQCRKMQHVLMLLTGYHFLLNFYQVKEEY